MNKIAKKSLIGFTTFTALSVIGASSILAQTASPTSGTSQRTVNQQQRIQNGIMRADNEIAARINSLNLLVARINDIKKLSTDTKNLLTTQVQSQLTALNATKTKIDADTDINTLRTDIQSIFTSYRIYALFIPKTHILVGADGILQAVSSFTDIQNRLQADIQKAQSEGKDVSALSADLSDMQFKVADAQTQANNAVNVVTPLQPQVDMTPYKSAFQTARSALQTALHDLQAARQDAVNIIQGLKQMRVNTATPSATPNQ